MYPSLADGLVENVYHNYGCRFDPDHFDAPWDTEYIGLNLAPSISALDGYYNIVAWHRTSNYGRVRACRNSARWYHLWPLFGGCKKNWQQQ